MKRITMKFVTVIIVVLAMLVASLFSAPHSTDAGTSNFTQMMYTQLVATNKNVHLVTRVFEATGRASGNEGDTDIQLIEVGSDYFCGLHHEGAANGLPVPMARECWRDDQVVSVAFFVLH